MKNIIKFVVLMCVCSFAISLKAQETKEPVKQETANAEIKSDAKTDTAEAKPVIYFYRIKQFAGSALEPSVFVNDKAVARMDNGRFFGVTLEPGKHTFRMGDNQTGFEIDMKPGQTYYAKVTLEAGFLKGHGRLTLLQPEQGAFELKKVKPLGTDKILDRSLVTIYDGSDKKDEKKD